ncbi:tetratricopeptide repeat protein [candidate division WOR-3 bacterium]|nr:tetratricopeptide repeat protein [candidate division WOR-3 bacterium]
MTPEEIVPQNQDEIEDMINSGLSYIEEKKYKEAEELFKKAAESGSSEANYNLGVLYGMVYLKDLTYEEMWEENSDLEIWFERAELAYQTAIELDKKNIHAMRNLATLYAERNQKEDALTLLRKVLEISQDEDYNQHIKDQMGDVEAM